MSGKKWTLEQRAKIYYAKHKRQIIDGLLEEGLIERPQDAKRKFISLVRNRKKGGSGLDSDETVMNVITNRRFNKSWDTQVAENLKTMLKEQDRWEDFRRYTGWNYEFDPSRIEYIDYYNNKETGEKYAEYVYHGRKTYEPMRDRKGNILLDEFGKPRMHWVNHDVRFKVGENITPTNSASVNKNGSLDPYGNSTMNYVEKFWK